MSKKKILDKIWDEMHYSSKDAFEFIDWLEDFIRKEKENES